MHKNALLEFIPPFEAAVLYSLYFFPFLLNISPQMSCTKAEHRGASDPADTWVKPMTITHRRGVGASPQWRRGRAGSGSSGSSY